jgi:hypothetical protein
MDSKAPGTCTWSASKITHDTRGVLGETTESEMSAARLPFSCPTAQGLADAGFETEQEWARSVATATKLQGLEHAMREHLAGLVESPTAAGTFGCAEDVLAHLCQQSIEKAQFIYDQCYSNVQDGSFARSDLLIAQLQTPLAFFVHASGSGRHDPEPECSDSDQEGGQGDETHVPGSASARGSALAHRKQSASFLEQQLGALDDEVGGDGGGGEGGGADSMKPPPLNRRALPAGIGSGAQPPLLPPAGDSQAGSSAAALLSAAVQWSPAAIVGVMDSNPGERVLLMAAALSLTELADGALAGAGSGSAGASACPRDGDGGSGGASAGAGGGSSSPGTRCVRGEIDRAGGSQGVLRMCRRWPEVSTVCARGVNALRAFARDEAACERLLALGAVDVVLAALVAHVEVAEVVLSCAAALHVFAFCTPEWASLGAEAEADAWAEEAEFSDEDAEEEQEQ